jgi:hypothetical protein
VIRRKTNRRHMTGDHHDPDGRETTLLVRAMDDIFGTHRFCGGSPRGWCSWLANVHIAQHEMGDQGCGRFR